LAQHKSARKRARQSERRRERNRAARTRLKTAVKQARAAISGGKADEVQVAVRTAEGELRRAASKGLVPKKRASRQVSRLARSARRLSK
jgi:small subunit ribosomal protein S20